MAGRKSVYDEKIRSRFDDIEKWLKGGATEEQVASALGIAKSTWFKYKAEKKEFSDFIKTVDRNEIILDLRSALLIKAIGFSKSTKKAIKCKTIEYENGKRKSEREEVVFYDEEQYFPPDVAALNLALKNYDKDNWANDPQAMELKKQELELRKEMAESKEW